MYFPKYHKLYDCHIQNFISRCHTFIAIDTRHTSESHSCSQPKPSQLQSFITSNTNNFPNQLSLNVPSLTLVFWPITTFPVPNTQLQLYHVTISSLTWPHFASQFPKTHNKPIIVSNEKSDFQKTISSFASKNILCSFSIAKKVPDQVTSVCCSPNKIEAHTGVSR